MFKITQLETEEAYNPFLQIVMSTDWDNVGKAPGILPGTVQTNNACIIDFF